MGLCFHSATILSLLVLTLQYAQKTPKWKENLPETFDRGEDLQQRVVLYHVTVSCKGPINSRPPGVRRASLGLSRRYMVPVLKLRKRFFKKRLKICSQNNYF